MTGRAGVVAAVCLVLAGATSLRAHKPITSKFTYNEHVFPIFRDRCARCHVEGGVAPMSLVTYAAAYPWAESIRAELVAGHMPPAQVDDAFAPVRRPQPLSPRELDTIVTWATGGTPEGPVTAKPPPVVLRNEWPLGAPDATIDLPDAVTLGPGEMQTEREFVLRDAALDGRRLRAVDLLPGTPAIVRRATITARGSVPRTIAVWLPGGDGSAAPDDASFAIEPGSDIVVTVTYRKTWKYENASVSDRSRIGVYFARPGATRGLREATIDAGGTRMEGESEVAAVRLAAPKPDAEVTVRAIRPDGSRLQLVAALASPEWSPRFWFERPVRLPKGTRVEVVARTAAAAELVLIPDR